MDPFRVPRIENRVPGIIENYHRVPRIRENRVPRGPYRVTNIFLRKRWNYIKPTVVIFSALSRFLKNSRRFKSLF